MTDLKKFNPQDLTSEKDVRDMADYVYSQIVKAATKEDKSDKEVIKVFLQRIYESLISNNTLPQTKFYCLLMMRQMTDKIAKKNNQEKTDRLFSILMNNKLLVFYKKQGESIDPHKTPVEKGRKYFKNNEQIGNNYICIILQSLKFWALKFPTTSAKQPTTYKKYYEELQMNNVVMPMEFKFYDGIPLGKRENETGRQRKFDVSKHIDALYQKYLGYMIELRSCSSSEAQKLILEGHGLIETDESTYNSHADQVLNSENENLIKNYFSMKGFMEKQNELFFKYIAYTKDYASYITQMNLTAEEIFHELKSKDQPKKQQNQQNKNDIHLDVLDKVNHYFQKLENRSPSPGFNSLTKSLSKTKFSKRSTVAVSKKIAKSFTSNPSRQSKIASIFMNPPNVNPQHRRFEGAVIEENKALKNQFSLASNLQGMRRFKTSNFKNKCVLFENGHVQVGIKCEMALNMSVFEAAMRFELFFGNLTNENLNNFQIQYKGDNNIALYANPKQFDSSLLVGTQVKQNLMLVPLRVPFPFIVIRMQYRIGSGSGKLIKNEFLLPNSIIRLTQFQLIQVDQFNRFWNSSIKLKSLQFRLSRYVPPDNIVKWISNLSVVASYDSFLRGEDYELICGVLISRRYSGVLKIIVRGDLSVILQLGVDGDGQDYLSYLLCSLELLIKQIN